jgi:hypothetical protein
MRQIIEIVISAALLIVLSVLPGYAQERGGVTPAGATTLTAAPTERAAAFDAFLFIDGIAGETDDKDDSGGGGSTPHCYEDEELQMSICE